MSTTEATATEYVLTFPPAPQDVADPEGNYRCWLAKVRFSLVHRTRLFAGKHALSWFDLIDPDDGLVMGRVDQNALGIEVKLRTRSFNPKTGKPGCVLRDTFKCAGDLAGAGPWKLARVMPCRNGCESCVAPDTLAIERA